MIKGICTLTFRDKDTEEITKTITKENQLQEKFFEEIGLRNENFLQYLQSSGWGMYISTETNLLPRNQTSISGVYAVFNVTSSHPSQTNYYVLEGRLNFTGTARSFNSLGIARRNETTFNNNSTSTINNYLTQLVLPSTITQEVNENIDFQYRLIFNIQNINAHNFNLFLSNTQGPTPYENTSYVDQGNNNSFLGDGLGTTKDFLGGFFTISSLYKIGHRTSSTGYAGIFGKTLVSHSNRPIIANKITGERLIKNVFGHSSSSTYRFYNVNNLATGSQIPIMGGSKSTLFPEDWHFIILPNGNYILAKINNMYLKNDLGVSSSGKSKKIIPYFPYFTTLPHVSSSIGNGSLENEIFELSESKFIFWDSTGVAICDWISGDHEILEDPSIQNINYAYRDNNGVIWIADTTSGLWKYENGLFTSMNPDSCKSITSIQGTVYVLFSNRLSNENDFTVAILDSADPGVSNYSVITKIMGHPTENALLFKNDNDRDIWFSDLDTLSTTFVGFSGGSDPLDDYPLKKSNPAIWFTGRHIRDRSGNSLRSPGWGSALSAWGGGILNRAISRYSWKEEMLNSDGTITDLGSRPHEGGGPINGFPGIYLLLSQFNSSFISVPKVSGNGVFHLGIHEVYDWNGTSWGEVGVSRVNGDYDYSIYNGKPIHATDEPLVEGMSVRWEETNPGNPVAFATRDRYSVMVYDGFLQDNVSSFKAAQWIYMKPKIDVTVNMSIPAETYTVPEASDPLFIELDYDDAYTSHNLQIDGIKAEILDYNDSAPLAGQIKIDTGGIIRFNTNDIGKTLTGNYAYIEHESY